MILKRIILIKEKRILDRYSGTLAFLKRWVIALLMLIIIYRLLKEGLYLYEGSGNTILFLEEISDSSENSSEKEEKEVYYREVNKKILEWAKEILKDTVLIIIYIILAGIGATAFFAIIILIFEEEQ